MENYNQLSFGQNFWNPSSSKSVFHLGWLCALGSSINKNIIIICSDLALRFLRNDSNPYVFLKFCDGPPDDQNTLIIGVSGFSTFHYIDNNSACIQKFLSEFENNLALTMEDIINLSNRVPFTRTTEILNTLDESILVDEIVGLDDMAEDLINISTNSNSLADMIDQNISRNENSNTLSNIINEFERLDLKSKYSSTTKIDFYLSSHILSQNLDIKCNQTFDIDGIFVLVDQVHISNLIKCPLTIKDPMIAWKRDQNTFKNTFKSQFDNFESFQMIKFGFLKFETGNCELFVCYGLNSADINDDKKSKMALINHLAFVKDAVEIAKNFPCNRCPEHRANCPSQDYAAQRESSVPFSGLKEDNISTELVPCFFYHLNIALHRLLNVQGLKFIFYLRMIGSKNLLVSSSIEKLSNQIESLTSSIDFLSLPDENVFIDFCIHSVPFDSDEAVQVKSVFNFSL